MCSDCQHVRRRITDLNNSVENKTRGDNCSDQIGQRMMHRTDSGPHAVW